MALLDPNIKVYLSGDSNEENILTGDYLSVAEIVAEFVGETFWIISQY